MCKFCSKEKFKVSFLVATFLPIVPYFIVVFTPTIKGPKNENQIFKGNNGLQKICF